MPDNQQEEALHQLAQQHELVDMRSTIAIASGTAKPPLSLQWLLSLCTVPQESLSTHME